MSWTYGYYSVSDPSKEIIAKSKAQTIDEATSIFARRKGLILSKFNKIFKVEAYDGTNKKTQKSIT